jgi:hypothetical protein
MGHCDWLYPGRVHAFEQARGGGGAWYGMELTERLPHTARALQVDWDESTRYAGLIPEP